MNLIYSSSHLPTSSIQKPNCHIKIYCANVMRTLFDFVQIKLPPLPSLKKKGFFYTMLTSMQSQVSPRYNVILDNVEDVPGSVE